MAAVLAAAACSDGEPQVIEEYLPVEISFILSDPDGLIDEGSEVAVISGCLRDGETVSMSAAPVARFKTSAAVSGRVEITPVSDDDKVYARYGDTRITYTVISPYSGNASLEPQIPAEQKYGEPFPTLVYGSVTTDDVSVPVVVPVLSRPAGAVLSLKIPSDLVASKTAVLSGLSVLGVSVDFGDGLELSVDRTVDVLVEPFTVPQGGIPVSFTTADGEAFSSSILSGAADSGLETGPGEVIEVFVPSADPFKPCTFPVIFPLGRNPDARIGYYNYSDDQPDWSNRGIWYCFSQKQAYATWNKVSDPSPLYFQKRELVNTGDIGSIGLKGIWTGDYFEFVFPVENIPAGAVVSFEAPFYGRQQPVFWTVSWLDGGEWKSSGREVSAWDGTTLQASFATMLQGCEISYRFRLENAIERGELRVRLTCTDGRYQADTQTNTVVVRDLPYNDGSIYQSPFYFYCAGSDMTAFTWNVAAGADEPETGSNEDLTVYDQNWQWEN